jgi:hypothetical protein
MTFCDSSQNVQLFAGLMLYKFVRKTSGSTNPGMFEANDQIELKSPGLTWAAYKRFYVK